MIANTQTLFEEAKVLSSYEHLAAVFDVTVEELLTPENKAIIERAKLVSIHETMKLIKMMADAKDKDCIKLWAQLAKLVDMDKSVPISPNEKLDPQKVLDAFAPPPVKM